MLQSQGLRAAAGAGGFIPFVADVLLVGTGGGGDYGGGAGGLVVTYTTQTVQKGDIFRVGIGDNPSARDGGSTFLTHTRNSSTIVSVTADGGGAGGGGPSGTGPGGGGLPYTRVVSGSSTLGTTAGGVRNPGGNGGNGGGESGGGGGGALGDGGSGNSTTNPSASVGGSGGYGIQNDYETGVNQWYGHGGGGGARGTGGTAPPGGAAGTIQYGSVQSGANGFGHGGGGTWGSATRGGTGIVVIRTPIAVNDPELVDTDLVYSVSTYGAYKVFKISVADNDFIVW